MKDNPKINCACGCGATLRRFSVKGRERRFVNGHNAVNPKYGWTGIVKGPCQVNVAEYNQRSFLHRAGHRLASDAMDPGVDTRKAADRCRQECAIIVAEIDRERGSVEENRQPEECEIA